jgi:hypothetical protein
MTGILCETRNVRTALLFLHLSWAGTDLIATSKVLFVGFVLQCYRYDQLGRN